MDQESLSWRKQSEKSNPLYKYNLQVILIKGMTLLNLMKSCWNRPRSDLFNIPFLPLVKLLPLSEAHIKDGIIITELYIVIYKQRQANLA